MRAMTTWFRDAYASWQKGGVETPTADYDAGRRDQIDIDKASDEEIDNIVITAISCRENWASRLLQRSSSRITPRPSIQRIEAFSQPSVDGQKRAEPLALIASAPCPSSRAVPRTSFARPATASAGRNVRFRGVASTMKRIRNAIEPASRVISTACDASSPASSAAAVAIVEKALDPCGPLES